jgi:hypothetical protein
VATRRVPQTLLDLGGRGRGRRGKRDAVKFPLLGQRTLRDNRPMVSNDITTMRFGEVVEASVEQLMGQCHQLYEAPALGTLVRAGEDVFGVVSGIATSALDPSRRVIARGADVETEAEIYAAHPQLEKLLRTDVKVAVTGHREANGVMHQYLPSQPPRIHTFLYTCTPDEVRSFFGVGAAPRLDFLYLLAGFGGPGDDALAAALRNASRAFDDPRAFLIAASRAVAMELSGDTARINAIVRRLPIGEGTI